MAKNRMRGREEQKGLSSPAGDWQTENGDAHARGKGAQQEVQHAEIPFAEAGKGGFLQLGQ